ncbi:MAG TPA: hypothetical protein PLD47_05760 [Aggregatilineales bacterium]|nr:hypothetical protein [Anaerolineales bacterium]HRE47213.1 hypothetical protein [Aggregatilineales bacterium]
MLYVVLILAVFLTIIAGARARNIALRRVPGFEAAARILSGAVEGGRGAHVSLGSGTLGGVGAGSVLAGSEIAYQAALRTAHAEFPVRVTTSDPLTLVLAQDRLRRAMRLRGAEDRFRGTFARWYPSGSLSLAFAAGVGAALLEGDYVANVITGRFGAELILIGENATRYDRGLVAHSDLIEGQSVAYVIADNPLFGEELYLGNAYEKIGRRDVGSIVAMDSLRFAIVILILLFGLLSGLGVAF